MVRSDVWLMAMLLMMVATPVRTGAAADDARVEPDEVLRVPGNTAYGEPDSRALQVSQEGVEGWSDAGRKAVWFGWLETPGPLNVVAHVGLPDGNESELKLAVGPVTGEESEQPQTVSSQVPRDGRVSFGTVQISRPGYHRFELAGVQRSGATFGRIRDLSLSGEAIRGAQFNLKPRRNAASVHLLYPLPKETETAVFYNELTVETEPLWSYYMACGFHRGYFGIQVNSPTERRIIFSVWDSGNEGIDRNKVKPEDQVQLLAKGDSVVAHGFGNEGTGGHSHLVYDWKAGETYRFAVTAEPDGKHTTFAGYFWFPETGQWGLIAKFKAPKDGGYLRGLYSFNENFIGNNGHLLRKAAFGNQWIRTPTGEWQELLTARFSHDVTGGKDRFDYSSGVENGQFFLANGGFLERGIKYGQTMTRQASGQKPPVLDLP